MNTKIKTIVAAATLAVIGLASSASAQILLTSGDVTFALTFRAEGTTPAGQAGTRGSNVYAYANTDPLVGQGTSQYSGDNPSLKLEDSWGIFEVNSITQGTGAGSTKFEAASIANPATNFRLFGIFYGSVDQSQTSITETSTNVFQQTFQAQGLTLDIYKIFDPSVKFTDNIAVNGAAGHTGFGQYTGITDIPANLLLRAVIDPMGLQSTATYSDLAGTNLRQSSSIGTLDTTYANTNPGFFTFLNPGTSLTTFSFSVESQRASANDGFLLAGTTSSIGVVAAVPEPSTYALFGVVALMGLVAVRRFRSTKASAA